MAALFAGFNAPMPCLALPDQIADQGTFRVIHKKDHRVLCHSTWKVEQDGPESVFLESGEGTCHGYSTPVTWESETRSLAANPRLLHYTVRRIAAPDRGAVVKTTWRTLNSATGVLTARIEEVQDQPLPPRERTWPNMKEVATPSSLLFVIRQSLVDGKTSGSIPMVTSEPNLYNIRWVKRGTERVTVPAGTYECVKLELLVDLKLLGWLRPLLPKLYLWYTARPPHHWIRYEGLEDGIKSAKVLIERTSPPPQPASE